MPSFYFVRVNAANSVHNDPRIPKRFIPDEPPPFPRKTINHVGYCLKNNVIRIGWPACENLHSMDIAEKLKTIYDKNQKDTSRLKGYLESFRDMPTGSVVLMPDKKRPGILYIGEVIGPYKYFFNIERGHWFECAHRHKVRWDLNHDGAPYEYQAEECGISIRGGFWHHAFAHIDALPHGIKYVSGIENARKKRK